MYAKGKNYVTYFEVKDAKHTDKTFFGRVSEANKTGKTKEDGAQIYEFENWNARFVGNARKKAATLKDKQNITLLEWNAHVGAWDKEKQRNNPYLMIMDFELHDNDKK
jgi:hypothetical protein